jgi:hypothetical protein
MVTCSISSEPGPSNLEVSSNPLPGPQPAYDIMERSFLLDLQLALVDLGVEHMTRAVASVEQDEELLIEEKAALISVLMTNFSSVNIYLSLTNSNVHQAWITCVLA